MSRPAAVLVTFGAAGIACAACSSGSPHLGPDAGIIDASDGDARVELPPPRPLAPISVTRATSRRPTFRWQLAPGTDGAVVEICVDRSCSHLATTFAASGAQAQPSADLPSGVVFWRLRGMSAGRIGATPGAVWELALPAVSAPVATTWGALLDADGDGYADVLVGDSDARTPTQRVFLFRGGAAGPDPSAPTVLSAPAPVVGYAASVASAGDVDGDGYGDLVVGSPGEDTVYVYRGGPSAFTDPPATVLRGASMSGFGAAVSAAGDVDGDGYGDVVVGMPQQASGGSMVTGAAVIVYGAATGLSLDHASPLAPPAGSTGQGFGQFVATGGDVDGDGLADVLVWGGIELTDPMRVALYLGSDRPFGAAPNRMLQYEGSAVSWLGNANLVACAGDVNGDGYTDVVVSTAAPPTLAYEADHLSLFLGSASGPRETPWLRVQSPLPSTDHFGMTVMGLDFDADGLDDLAAGALSYPPDRYAAVVYASSTSGPTFGVQVLADDPAATFRREVTSPGDVDGDGYADFVVGYPDRSTPSGDGGTRHGAVEVHPGGAKGVAAAPRWTLLPPDGTTVAFGATLAPP